MSLDRPLLPDRAPQRGVARGVAWALVLAPPALLLGAEALAWALLAAAVLGVPTGWLEARCEPSTAQPSPRTDLLVMGHVGLGLLFLPQARYLGLLIEHGGAPDAALRDMLTAQRSPAPLLAGVVLAAAALLAGVQRVRRVDPREMFLGLFVVTLVTCGVGGGLFLGWFLIELGNRLGDRLERAWLRARSDLRALERVPPARQWLLAYLGHRDALAALGAGAPRPAAELGPWLRGLELAGGEAVGRAALAIARRALRAPPRDPAWAEAHAALLRWVADPGEATAKAVVDALDRLPAGADGPQGTPEERALRLYAGVLRRDRWGRGSALAEVARALGDPEQVREEVTAELLSWAFEAPAEPRLRVVGTRDQARE